MRMHPALLTIGALMVCSCAEPISVKVTTTPVTDVELTLNRTVSESTSNESEGAAATPKEQKWRTGKSDCVFKDVSQDRDLTIVARKEGYEVTQVTIPAHAEPLGWSLLWSKRAWSNLIWSAYSPHSQYLILEDAQHREIDLTEEGVTIEMKPVSSGEHYKAAPLTPFDASKMKGW